MAEQPCIVWGPELSPFLLKLESLLVRAGVPFRRLPRDGSRLENLGVALRIERAKRDGAARRPTGRDPLDEYPLVPFLVTPGGEVLYDSSALAAWLDARSPQSPSPLVPRDPATRFACLFLDEAFDEWGLYMVHHNRWKLAAGDNDRPGLRLAREYRRHLPPLFGPLVGRWFERRQVRRLPYLLSVAPAGYRVDGLSRAMTPPSRQGFPPTHEVLEKSWERTLAAMEAVLVQQPWLLGDAFTMADASAYGQLSMNLTDTAAARRLHELAPRVFAWLVAIRDRVRAGSGGPTGLSPTLTPLAGVFLDTFVPLMRANEAAWERMSGAGLTRFNEAAFDAGQALFDVEIDGRPCRSVVKTFQVRVWRDLRREWAALGDGDRRRLGALFGSRSAGEIFSTGAGDGEVRP